MGRKRVSRSFMGCDFIMQLSEANLSAAYLQQTLSQEALRWWLACMQQQLLWCVPCCSFATKPHMCAASTWTHARKMVVGEG